MLYSFYSIYSIQLISLGLLLIYRQTVFLDTGIPIHKGKMDMKPFYLYNGKTIYNHFKIASWDGCNYQCWFSKSILVKEDPVMNLAASYDATVPNHTTMYFKNEKIFIIIKSPSKSQTPEEADASNMKFWYPSTYQRFLFVANVCMIRPAPILRPHN